MVKTEKNPIQYGKKDIKNLTKKSLYKGFFTMMEYQFQYKKFDGTFSDVISREVFERDEAVLLLPYDPIRDTVVLLEQFRVGAIDKNDSPWLLEIVAGMMDKGNESKEEVARREAHEEAGIVVNRVREVMSYFASPGGCSEKLTVMVGEVDSSTAHGVHGLEEENEDIRVHVVSREQAYQWVESGLINNAGTVIALQWLQLNYQHLKTTWIE